MPKYNHACTIAFEVLSDDPHGEDITTEMLREAIARRLKAIETFTANTGQDEMLEACLPPYDTFEVNS